MEAHPQTAADSPSSFKAVMDTCSRYYSSSVAVSSLLVAPANSPVASDWLWSARSGPLMVPRHHPFQTGYIQSASTALPYLSSFCLLCLSASSLPSLWSHSRSASCTLFCCLHGPKGSGVPSAKVLVGCLKASCLVDMSRIAVVTSIIGDVIRESYFLARNRNLPHMEAKISFVGYSKET